MNKRVVNDILLGGAFLLFALIIFLVIRIGVNGENLTAQIWYEDEIIDTINLANQDKEEKKTKTYFFESGDFMIVEYKYNSIRVISASCDNKDCVKQGWTSSVNKSLVCMDIHYKIVIISNYSDYDVVVG